MGRPCGCCCDCYWIVDRWNIPSDTVEMVNFASGTAGYSVITERGTPIRCKGEVKTPAKPCRRVTFGATFLQTIALPNNSWVGSYRAIEIFDDYELIPNGQNVKLAGSIDLRVVYAERNQTSGPRFNPPLDADAPVAQPTLTSIIEPYVTCRQGDQIWRGVIATGVTGVGKGDGSLAQGVNVGDWVRWQFGDMILSETTYPILPPPANNTNGWYRQIEDVQGFDFLTDTGPDLAAGSDPITFGYMLRSSWIQGVPGSTQPGGNMVDSEFTIEVDRLCIRLTPFESL